MNYYKTLEQWYDCPSSSEVTPMDVGKYIRTRTQSYTWEHELSALSYIIITIIIYHSKLPGRKGGPQLDPVLGSPCRYDVHYKMMSGLPTTFGTSKDQIMLGVPDRVFCVPSCSSAPPHWVQQSRPRGPYVASLTAPGYGQRWYWDHCVSRSNCFHWQPEKKVRNGETVFNLVWCHRLGSSRVNS